MQAAQETSITSGVNEARFLDHLRTMFSTSTTVLAECMQNSRRAGATSVIFDYDLEMSSLTIIDNGHGITDFRALITVAESGWSQETLDSECPFGIGFFSVCFAAETVTVESLGKQIIFSSEDLIAKRQIAIQSSSFIGGTCITLKKCKLDESKIGDALMQYARGFAIPIIWQGEEIPRPHARENLVCSITPVGSIHVPGIHDASRLGQFAEVGVVYCQGLPVNVSDFSRRYYSDVCRVIVHVDHLKYQPRMPDRDSLIDSAQAQKDILSAIRYLWLRHLEKQKAILSAESFVETYWSAAESAGVLEIMNTVPVLPRQVLSYVGETPVQNRDGENFMSQHKVHATKTEVESGDVQLCHEIDFEGDGDEFAKLMFAEKAGFIFVSNGLPREHWAQPFIRNLRDEKIRVAGKVINSAKFYGGFASGTLKLVESLAITITGKTLVLTEPVALGSNSSSNEMTYLVPKGVMYAGYVLRQCSTYTDDNGNDCSTDYELDSDRFNDLIAILSGEEGVDTLSKCLSSAGACNKSNLRDNTYLVRFDDQGRMTIKAA